MTAAPEKTAEGTGSGQKTRQKTAVFPLDPKRKTSLMLSRQADDDITELMRRGRQTVPGNAVADAVRIMRVLPPEFVTMLFTMLDTGGAEEVERLCRRVVRENI